MKSYDQAFNEIVSYVMTKDACVILIQKLKIIRDAVYLKNPLEITPKFLDLNFEYGQILNPGFDELVSPAVLSDYIDQLLSYLSKLEYVELTLAFHPTPVFMHTLYGWFKSYFTFPFYLNVTADPDLLGGVVLSYKGVYVDMSLSKTLSDYFLSNKEYVLSKL